MLFTVATTDPKKQVFPSLDGSIEDKKLAFFLAASHQLKGPLATIQWCLRSLTEYQAEIPPAAQKLIGTALGQTDTVSRLVSDLLHLVKLESGTPLTLTSLSLADLVRKVFDRYGAIAHQKDVHIVLDPLERVSPIMGEAVLLEQVVVNIVDNAIKYTAAGGEVRLHLSEVADRVIFRVSDQGIGIPDLEQQRIFTEFFRGEEAKAVASGSGLGLVLTKQIVEKCGGEINLESVLHKGTTVEISFPRA
jgi:signal transduction histidine kinase